MGNFFYSGVTSLGTAPDKCIGGSGTANMGLQSGTEVDLVDGAGVTLGVSHLVEASDSGIVNVPGTVSATCHFTFEFSGVKKADFYKLSIGRVPGPTYSYQDLDNANWQMTVR